MSDKNKKTVTVALLAAIAILGYAVFQEAAQWLKHHSNAALQPPAKPAPALAEKPAAHPGSAQEPAVTLAEIEEDIPLLDGYIAVSRIVGDKRSGLTVFVDPPQIRHGSAILPAHYSTGLFRIRGSGTLSNVRALLQSLEANLPFSHAQELRCAFPPASENQVNGDVHFTLSLLVVLRSNEDSTTGTALAWQRRTP